MTHLRSIVAGGALLTVLGVVADRAVGEEPGRSSRNWGALFNGRDLAGWQPVARGASSKQAKQDWGVEDGSIVCRGKGHTWLRSGKQYDDFNLRLEYQVTPGANSGIYVRVPANGDHGSHDRHDAPSDRSGFEVQILDDRAARYAGLQAYQYSASVYEIAAAAPRVSKPAGTWNTLEINCAGQNVMVTHNGVRVVAVSPERFPAIKSRNRKGFLGLQSHNGIVRFRNIEIGPPTASK